MSKLWLLICPTIYWLGFSLRFIAGETRPYEVIIGLLLILFSLYINRVVDNTRSDAPGWSPWSPVVFPKRRWVFLERFVIPHPDDPARNHFTRYRIFQCPLFGWYVDHFESADAKVFHDSSRHSISITVKGWYTEQVAGRRDNGGVLGGYPKRYGFLSINIKRAKTYHFVSRVSDKGMWSVSLASKRVQEWGFGDVNGWTPHANHEVAQRADEAMRLRRDMEGMR